MEEIKNEFEKHRDDVFSILRKSDGIHPDEISKIFAFMQVYPEATKFIFESTERKAEQSDESYNYALEECVSLFHSFLEAIKKDRESVAKALALPPPPPTKPDGGK